MTTNLKVKLISPSAGIAGDALFKPKYEIGKQYMVEELGWEVTEGQHALSGIEKLKDPIVRTRDINESIVSNDIDLLIANIGGTTAHELFYSLNHSALKETTVSFMGFSDSTSLHFMFMNAGIKTYYGNSTFDSFAEAGGMFQYDREYMTKVLKNKDYDFEITASNEWTSELLDWRDRKFDHQMRQRNNEEHGLVFDHGIGIVEGHLIGGCLNTIFTDKDKEYFPSLSMWMNSIVFLEVSENTLSPLEFKQHLIKIEDELNVANGIIFGKTKDEKYFNEYFKILKELNIPFVYNMNFGHTSPKVTLPYGDKLTIDFDDKKVFLKYQEIKK